MNLSNHARLSLLLVIGATSSDAATVTPFGPPIDSEIVSAFIPPTRSDDPYIATDQSVFRWDNNAENWEKIYTLPWSSARIMAISGYRKSSKPIYVVHSAGVARSNDAGGSWIESIPTGFANAADELIDILVNPSERQHAILITGSDAWESVDYGATWTKIHLADVDDPIIGGGFVVQAEDDSVSLLLASRTSLLKFNGIPSRRLASWSAPYPLEGLLTHPRDPVAIARMVADRWTILQAPFASGLMSTSPAKVSGSHFAPNRAGSSSVWVSRDDDVALASLVAGSDTSLPVADLPGPATRLLPHPDDQDSAYAYRGHQLYLIDDAFTEIPPEFILPAPQAIGPDALRWPMIAPPPGEEVTAAAKGAKDETEKALQAIIDSQPPFTLVASKAIRFAFGRPVAFAEWQRQARSRHWLPELRVQAGVRERNMDTHQTFVPVDQFGIPGDPEDLSLSDEIRTLGHASVILRWDLSDLIFDAEQVDVHRERRYTHKQRRELIEDLSRLYHSRTQKIAAKEGLFGEPSPQQHLRLVLEISELTDIINGFCGEEILQ